VFVRLSLEVFQAGLSWGRSCARVRRSGAAFDGFDRTCGGYGTAEVVRLMGDPPSSEPSQDPRHDHERAGAVALCAPAAATTSRAGLAGCSGPTSRSDACAATGRRCPPRPEGGRAREELRRVVTLWGLNVFACMAAMGIVDVHIVGSHRRGSSGLWTRTGRRRKG
jgi:DNA-3-methyladenine glycosylase I